ncbi:hypothetical protein OSTOST_05459, partial [Ostertagia ostertagi]
CSLWPWLWPRADLTFIVFLVSTEPIQGGPGASSTGFGNFEETGPKRMNSTDNAATWVLLALQVADLVYVDNPVGPVSPTSTTIQRLQQMSPKLDRIYLHGYAIS